MGLLKVLSFEMKKTLGYMSDISPSTGNTALEYHAGTRKYEYTPTIQNSIVA